MKTDLNHHTGLLSVEEGAKGPVKLALMTDEGKTGLFFDQKMHGRFYLLNFD